MTQLGFGVVGVKGMGRGHCEALKKTNSARLAAVMDIDAELAQKTGAEYEAKAYSDYGDFLADPAVNVVDICTPHIYHPDLAVQAMKAGKMVLCEKPLAITLTDADRMVRTSERTGQPLGVVFQQRTRAINRRFKELLAEAGELYRISMVQSMLRTQAYYGSAAWRGTWTHEGGGVLVNQAPHALDLFQWLFGMPETVLGWTRTRCHAITVEDQAFAHMEFAGGTVATWIANTTDCPATNRIEAFGVKSSVRIIDGRLERAVIQPPLDEFITTSPEMWGKPQAKWETIEVPEAGGDHAEVIEQYCQAVMNGNPPPVTVADGRKSVELACAIIFSSETGHAVRLPVKRKAYDELLDNLRRKEAKALKKK